jgi:hypothetical protein
MGARITAMIMITDYRKPLHSQFDVERYWTHLCRKSQWTKRELWVALIDPFGRPLRKVVRVTDVPEDPDQWSAKLAWLTAEYASMVADFSDITAGKAPPARVAIMLARPGEHLTRTDHAWGLALTASARSSGVEFEVVHVATDSAVIPLPMDALI